MALGRRPDFRQVRRYINDIEPRFIEYTRHGLARYGPPDWTEEVDRLREKIAERHLPTAQRGRQRDTIALLRYLLGGISMIQSWMDSCPPSSMSEPISTRSSVRWGP